MNWLSTGSISGVELEKGGGKSWNIWRNIKNPNLENLKILAHLVDTIKFIKDFG